MLVQRYATFGVLTLAAVVAAVLAHCVQWSLAALALPNPHVPGSRELSVATAVAVATAAAAALLIRRHPTLRTLSDEVTQELLRVSWPKRDEVVRSTWIVIGTIVICSLYLGLLDAFWLWLTDALLGIGPGPAASAQASAR